VRAAFQGGVAAPRQSLPWVMPGSEGVTDSACAGSPPAWRKNKTAAIGLIDQQSLVRSLSPELMLVDPELAERARELLREPCETNGKGWHMSALGTHEITAGIGLGLEPPLSPTVVRGPSASMPMPANDNLSGLPSPPPAIRPPESATPAPEPAPAPQAELPQQPAPAQPEQAPAPAQPEPILPVAPPEPVQLQPEPPAAAPEPELPAMAPAEEAVLDYFAPPEPVAETLPELAPVEAAQVETVQLAEIQPITPVAPAQPVEEPVAELPAMAPPEPAVEITPAAFVAPEPIEVAQPVAEVEPEAFVAQEPELELVADPFEVPLPTLEPLAAAEPVASPELEELFAPKRSTQFRVVVRLKEGDGVDVGSFRDFGTAMEGAQEVIEQFSSATDGQWPFYAGRFIRPDLIVSVDVVEGDQA
jgi:hypothetical protein